MTMCKINSFTIGNTRIDNADKETRAKMNLDNARKDNADILKLEGYSVMDCSLTKELLKPHEFVFTLRHQTMDLSIDIIPKIIGKDVEVEVTTQFKGNDSSMLHFKGYIDKVSKKGLNLTCVAYSYDAKLQGPPKCRYFADTTISQIVAAVAPRINKSIVIQSDFNNLVFPYIVQYNESDYDFLIRLAKRFGCWLYYSGKDLTLANDQAKLVFGLLPNNPVKTLASNDVKLVNYEMETGNPNYWFTAHDYEKDTVLQTQGYSYELVLNPNGLTGWAVDGSTVFDSKDPKYYIDYPYSSSNTPSTDLFHYFKLFSEGEQMVTCRFISYRFDLQVGDAVTINNNGMWVITAVHLTWDDTGFPQNEVTAFRLPSDVFDVDLICAPYMDINAYPKSSAQRAVVVNNVDPKKMGRVQVRFVWQPMDMPAADQQKLPWIRIAQPYGGGKKDKGQGFYLLPEIGEEVMVGFEHDNMEKPFVIGSLYHDSDTADDVQMPEESWVETDQANKKNEVKAFRTKKGHTIEFHDVDGDDKYGFIRIYGNEKKDGPNYDIILSTDPIKDKDYTIESASICKDEGKDNFKIDKLRVLVRSNGGDIMLDAGDGDIVMNAMNIRLHTQQDLTAYIGGKEVITVEDTHFLETKDSGLHVKKNREVLIEEKDDYTSKNLVIAVSEDSKFSAKSLTLKTDQKTEIKASSLEASADHSVEINANSGLELNGGSKTDLKATNVTVKGDSSATLKATDVTVDGLFSTTVSGANLTIDATMGTRKGSWTDV